VSRRVFEAASGTMWLVALLFLPVLLGIPVIFEWSHADVVQANPIIGMKAPYLNVEFFVIRAVIYFAFWLLCRNRNDSLPVSTM
jgi:hypothetical protein